MVREAVILYLCRVLEADKKMIIFCDEKKQCHKIHLALNLLKIKSVELNGNLTQEQRMSAYEKFKGNTKIMIATDLASRGLDFDSIDLVINMNPQSDSAKFIHRVGRTCRKNKEGESITLVSAEEVGIFKKTIKEI